VYSLYISNEYVTEGTRLYKVCENKLMNVIVTNGCIYGSKQFACCWWSTSWLYMYFQNRNLWNNNFVNCFINYCNHVLPLMLWARISTRARCTTLCDKVCQWLATGRWISPGPAVSPTNKTERHDIAEILLKVALSTIKQTKMFYKIR
jgi:hypothetical protein